MTTATLLTSDAKEALRKGVRGIRKRLCDDLASATRGAYQLDVTADKARLSAAQRARRARLEAWIDEQTRAAAPKAPKKKETRDRFLEQVVEEAAHTLLNRVVLLRILEHHRLLAPDAPPVITGEWRSPAYAGEFLGYAGPLADADAQGYRALLDAVFAELALELPGLYGNVGLTALVPVPERTLREVVGLVNDPALASAWGDDTTLGWVYQYWNDPKREELDQKIAKGGKIEPHEIASKTQMFTERYMVEWLLQNSLGFTWLCMCKRNGWTPDADGVLPELERRRVAWRAKREAGEVTLDALMPVDAGLMDDWKYFVPQPFPEDAIAQAPASIQELKLLDPACGSGHFLVIAFGLLARMHEEEARHRGETWSAGEIAQRVVGDNLHGIDIDARAIQIAAAALWLRARLYAPEVRLARMNLVAPRFQLAALPKDDPARVVLETQLAEMGVPRATTASLIESLKGVDHLGTLLRVDRAIAALLDEAEVEVGPLFAHGSRKRKAKLEELVAGFLDAHAAEGDLGLRLEAEQLASGVRFVELAREGSYDLIVGNPPYQGISKTTTFEYVVKHYPRGKADLYAAFFERGLELLRQGGISALLTMRGWMFLGQFSELRKYALHTFDLRNIGDFDRGAFDEVPNEVLAVAAPIIRRSAPSPESSVAVQPTPFDELAYDRQRTERKRAALLVQLGRREFDPQSFAVIEGEPIVYWWDRELLRQYARSPKLGSLYPARQGLGTRNDTRFLRAWWEVETTALRIPEDEGAWPGPEAGWVPYIKGAAGLKWMEPLSSVLRWRSRALELQTWVEVYRLRAPGQYIKNSNFYFRRGVAFTTIGSSFSARLHSVRSVFGEAGSSVFADDLASVLCVLNRTQSRQILESLNPTINFKSQDVDRLPLNKTPESHRVVEFLARSFDEHEAAREASRFFRAPGPSQWEGAQAWAQHAIDMPDSGSISEQVAEFEPPDAQAYISFAIGTALGRFGANGEGILTAAPPSALPAGILFVGASETYPDSLAHPSLAALHTAYESFAPPTGKKPPLRDWLRKDFFAYHRPLYENRPIYFPLSSEKKSFVAWVSIHRWTDATLPTLVADHVVPVLRQLDAEIHDANVARASSDKKTAMAAGKAYDTARRLRDELAAFKDAVTQVADHGAKPTDPACPERETDAEFSMDLDDGVMINSAALWPLLAPQWADPKKWWKQLCQAEGRKDYDWAHLAKRYFPTRVDAKCKEDPSLAVAHGCFWRYHPAKAFAWELRLQDEIRPDFTIDEAGSDEARAAWLQDHPSDAEAARQKETIRRARKAAKEENADEPATDDDAPASGEDDIA